MGGRQGTPAEAAELFPRVIGRERGEQPGPTLICAGSLHGNEPAGFEALCRVFDTLRQRRPRLSGELIGFTGNRSALALGRRYVDRDLNRLWMPELVKALRARRELHHFAAEHTEITELLHEVDRTIESARGRIYVVDLHTTSGDSPPFATIADTLQNRAFAFQFGIPIVLGLEEHLDGTFLGYIEDLTHVTVGFEGGRHEDRVSVDNLEACVWLALATTGVLAAPSLMPQVQRARERLREASAGVPSVLEVRHRHVVVPGEDFHMDPGFASFQPVMEGQLLGYDRSGAVRAPDTGRLLMPRYQAQGDDGFFVMRTVRPFWLAVSAALRHVKADALAHWLPGVRRDPKRPEVLMVDKRTARWYALEMFHLLGYRRQRLEGDLLVVSRRREPH